jgi:hypothetical protein
MLYNIANNVVTLTTQTVSPSDGTVTVYNQVLPYNPIPSIDPNKKMHLTIIQNDPDGNPEKIEIVNVTGIENVSSGQTTYNIERAQEGTSPEEFNEGSTVFLSITEEIIDSISLKEFREEMNSDSPNDTTNVAAWRLINSGNISLALVPSGNGGIIASIPDNSASGGNVRGNYSIDFQLSRDSSSQVASGDYSVLLGGRNNTCSGNLSSVVGGFRNIVIGNNSVIGSGENNEISSSFGFIGSGINNRINEIATYSVIVGGQDCLINASNSSVLGGYDNRITAGDFSSILSGSNNRINGAFNTILSGNGNEVQGNYSAVLSGLENEANGDYSVSSGRKAKAIHDGSWVLCDSQDEEHFSTQEDEIRFRFRNGMYLNNKKVLTNFALIEESDGNEIITYDESNPFSGFQSSSNVFCVSDTDVTYALSTAPVGYYLDVYKRGQGDIHFEIESGLTVFSAIGLGGTPRLQQHGKFVRIIKRTETEWVIDGDVA